MIRELHIRFSPSIPSPTIHSTGCPSTFPRSSLSFAPCAAEATVLSRRPCTAHSSVYTNIGKLQQRITSLQLSSSHSSTKGSSTNAISAATP